MRISKLFLLMFMLFITTSSMALDFMGNLDSYNPSGSSSTQKNEGISTSKASDTTPSKSKTATLSSGTTGYVSVNTSLNIRTGPWGQIVGSLKNNDPVQIVGQEGDWYVISHEGEKRYVHSRYIVASKGTKSAGRPSSASSSTSSSSDPNTKFTTGSQQNRIVQAAKDIVKKYSSYKSFPYAAGTEGGNLGCAQVISQTLKNAGVNVPVILGVDALNSKLASLGWYKAKVPPYLAGDVITYNPSHIGIIMENGNSVQAMSNSSSRRMPRYHNHDYMSIRHVMRRA